jgi:phosphopantothenoylcysteine synthetase/decarboxylase
MTDATPTRTLYVIACAAGAAPEVGRLIDRALQQRWDVHVIATPAAADFLDLADIAAQTGHLVQIEHRLGGAEPERPPPRADAIIVAPATFNTINKWARGISDNYALGVLAEAIGLEIPIVVLPLVNAALAAHPAFARSVALLRDAGVTIVLRPGEPELHPPGAGAERLAAFPWHLALDAADALVS